MIGSLPKLIALLTNPSCIKYFCWRNYLLYQVMEYWLINSDRSRVKDFPKNKQNKDKFFDYMFIDSGKIVGVLGKNHLF